MRLRHPGPPARTALAAGLLAVLLLANGCTVASVGLSVASAVGSTAFDEYRSGEYVAAVEASRRVCEMAVVGSCKHFGLAVNGWQVDDGITTAKLGDERGGTFTIRIAYVGPDRTALYIRAGLWGDDLCSRQLAYDVEAGALRLRSAARTEQVAQATRALQVTQAVRASHVAPVAPATRAAPRDHGRQATRTPKAPRPTRTTCAR